MGKYAKVINARVSTFEAASVEFTIRSIVGKFTL